jgi:hypothetical protein
MSVAILQDEFAVVDPSWSGKVMCGVKLSCGHTFWAQADNIITRALCPRCGRSRLVAWMIRTLRVCP